MFWQFVLLIWCSREELISACGLLCPKWNDYYSNTQTGAEEQNTNRALESSILKTIEKVPFQFLSPLFLNVLI